MVNDTEAKAAVRAAIGQVAPEIDPGDLDDTARLRQDLELDSLDFLRVVEGIAQSTGVDIPERDYPRVLTVGGLVAYLVETGGRD